MKITARTKTVHIPIKESETTDRVCKLLNHEITRHILGHQNMENGTKKGVGGDTVPLEE
jgi:hypothetical protein